MSREFNPLALVEILNRHGVAYVVIGGWAAQVHGATRATNDIDITPATSADNLMRLATAMKEMDARIRTAGIEDGLPFDFDADSLAGMAMLNLTTKYGSMDLSMSPAGTAGYDDLARSQSPREVDGQVVPVASLADIIRSKTAAGRAKDAEALPELEALQVRAVDVDALRAAIDPDPQV